MPRVIGITESKLNYVLLDVKCLPSIRRCFTGKRAQNLEGIICVHVDDF